MIWKSMPFSCRTIRQRWLNGSVVPEYKVIIFSLPSRACAHAAQKKYTGQERCPCPDLQNVISVDVFPVHPLERIDQREQNTKENKDGDADVDAVVARRLAHIVEIVDQVCDKRLVLQRRHRAG